MKALILADLHIGRKDEREDFQKMGFVCRERDVDAIVLCGDNAELDEGMRHHRYLFDKLREKYSCPIGFVVGNHELWGKEMGLSGNFLLNKIFPALAKEYDLTYLEKESMKVEDVTFVGTYGHYDYSFFRKGKGVTMRNILRGKLEYEELGMEKIKIWNDRKLIDWRGKSDKEICEKLVEKFERRVKEAEGTKISVSHTAPRHSLNGHPDSLLQYFYEPYSGSSRIGEVIEKYGGMYHFCGHTHAKASDLIGRTKVLNIGADYGLPRYIIFRKNDKKTSVKERSIRL